jgi:radical SAM superfamily enzyme YgiQ (UPF0313 family)
MGKKIILVNPPTMDYAYRELRKFALAVAPIGMAHIASYLESKDISVDIIDCDGEGYDVEETIRILRKEEPKYVGLMAMTATVHIAKEMIKEIRRSLPETVTILGGVHGTALPKRTMEEIPELDVVVMGEGEYTTYELIQTMDANAKLEDLLKVKGICFRRNEKIYENQRRPYISDLDSLPFPARHLLPMNAYEGPGWFRWIDGFVKPFISVFTSRGCPYNCNFCAAKIMCGTKVRYRSIDNVMKEIDHLKETYNIKILHFQDDTFTLNRERTIEICKELIRRDYRFHVMCSTRVDQVDEELLTYMKKAGIDWIFYGVESGNQEILNNCKKNITLEQIKRAFYLTKKAGISTHAGIILGHIGETKDTANDTIRFLLELMPDYAGIATLIPFPGSKAWEYCESNDIQLPSDWNDFGMVNSIPIAVNLELSSKELLKLRDKAIFHYYANPIRLLKFINNKKYNKRLFIRDHIFNFYALILRMFRLIRKLHRC